jgi:hypothetical protein
MDRSAEVVHPWRRTFDLFLDFFSSGLMNLVLILFEFVDRVMSNLKETEGNNLKIVTSESDDR